jgi:hypothetical protein
MPTYGDSNYAPQADADTLRQAAEIHSDGKRHKAALDHLTKTKAHVDAAHKSARKMLEKKTKKRMDKVFNSKPDEKEAPQMNQDDLGTAKEAKC